MSKYLGMVKSSMVVHKEVFISLFSFSNSAFKGLLHPCKLARSSNSFDKLSLRKTTSDVT